MSPQSNYWYRENVSSSVGLIFRFPRLVTFMFPCLVNQSNVSKPPIQNGGTEIMSPQSNYGYRENVSSSVGLTFRFPRLVTFRFPPLVNQSNVSKKCIIFFRQPMRSNEPTNNQHFFIIFSQMDSQTKT